MNTLQKEQLKFAKDTFKFYGEKPSRRAVKPWGGCNYRSENGKKSCAIGRHLETKLARELDDDHNGDGSNVGRIFDRLPAKLKKLGKSFLARIQEWHDSCDNFTSVGLTEDGEEDKVEIIDNIKNGEFK